MIIDYRYVIMKAANSIVRNLRALFGVVRIVTLIGLFTTPILLTPLPIMQTSGFVSYDTSQSRLPVTNDLAANGTRVHLKGLTAAIDIYPATPMPSDLLALRRQTMVPLAFATLLVWFLTSHFLWQLFRRLEKGEVFTGENFELVRKIGAGIIVCSFVEAGAKVWGDLQLSDFIHHHVQIAGLTIQHSAFANFDARFMVSGCIVLVVAEVFRQGLALKQEVELTV